MSDDRGDHQSEAELHARVTALFLEAFELPPSDQAEWLARSCDDEATRARVEAMLKAHTSEDSLLDRPILKRSVEESSDAELIDASARGRLVGPWRIIDRVGAGGMGVVYRAERADGLYERTVALKLLAPSAVVSTGKDLVRRLAAERQILARLEHEGIARLYDGGINDEGIPWLALEFVDGEPIDVYCDRLDLGIADRVRLFAKACDAVAYAHRSLVVHRDLKPAHILICENPHTEPSVKLLDFGVSSLIEESGDVAPHTAPRAMTPSYAAPEQVTHGAITTATDVYALGVVLYELLAGQRPYNLGGRTAADVERLVAHVDPPAPSTVASRLTASRLRGDLDTIVLKALAKEPDRRYSAASELATDLRRHLEGLPVEARPATARYRMSRFIHRHTVSVVAAVIVALALVVASGVSLWQASLARAEAAKAEVVNEFLVGLLGAANPSEDGRNVRVASLLDRAVERLDTGFSRQPALEALSRHTLGRTYYGLGLYSAADSQLTRALFLREREHGSRHVDVAETQHQLALVRQEMGDFRSADSLFSFALETHRARYGRMHTRTSTSYNDLGVLRQEIGDYAAAVELYRESLSIDEELHGKQSKSYLTSLGNLAAALADLGEADESAGLLDEQARSLRQYHPQERLSLANSLANLGAARYDQRRTAEAAELQAEAVRIFREELGDKHDFLAFGLNNYGSTLGALGRLEESEAALREAIAIIEGALGPEHPNLGYSLVNLGKTLQSTGRVDEAEAAYSRAARVFAHGFGADNPVVARALEPLGGMLHSEGRSSEAAEAYREVVRLRELAYGPESSQAVAARRAFDQAVAAEADTP